jgi:peptide/nickel transport system substrate-binding protein
MSTTDPVERTAYYHQMDAMMMSDAPVIVLYYDKVLRLTQHNVEGLPMNSMNLLDLKAVRLSGK